MRKACIISLLLIAINSVFAQAPKIHCNATWLVIADTSKNYSEMNKVAEEVAKKYKLSSDTNKTYNAEKNLLCLTAVFDPIMAGMYSRRTMAGEYVSLEYFQCYQGPENDSTFGAIRLHGVEIAGSMICVVAGIFTVHSEKRAQLFLNQLQEDYPDAYMIRRKDLDCYWIR